MTNLMETWVLADGDMTAGGDAAEIDRLLTAELEQIGTTDGGWRRLFRHRTDGSLWQLDYPQSELHGGGLRRLVKLDTADSTTWE